MQGAIESATVVLTDPAGGPGSAAYLAAGQRKLGFRPSVALKTPSFCEKLGVFVLCHPLLKRGI